MSLVKSLKILLFLGGSLWAQACDDGAGKPDPSSGAGGTDCDTVRYKDSDGDGFGDPAESATGCRDEAGWADNDRDCDDSDAEVSPDQAERCDGVDTNCDGVVDDESAVDATDWFTDDDGDGYGFGPPQSHGCSGAPGQVANNSDCNDDSSLANPMQTERCDEIDNNCNGEIDEGSAIDGTEFYEDADGDGWGTIDSVLSLCDVTEGWAAEPGDCDDDDDGIHPDMTDLCNGGDQDCDGYIDSGCGLVNPLFDTEANKIFKTSEAFMVRHMSVGDISGDGVDDLLIGNGMGIEKLHLIASPADTDEDGMLSESWVFEPENPTSAVARNFDISEDLNDDGFIDLIVADHRLDSAMYNSEVQIHFGPMSGPPDTSTPGVLLSAALSTTRWASQGIVLGDVTNDGSVDAIFTNYLGDVMVVWPTLSADSVLEEDAIIHDISGRESDGQFATGDFDGDMVYDLVFSASTANQLSLVAGPILSEADFAGPDSITHGDVSTQIAARLTLCDINADGVDEIITSTLRHGESSGAETSIEASSILVFSVAESATEPVMEIEAPEGEAYGGQCLDVDGDAQPDLLVESPLNDGSDTIANSGAAYLFFGSIAGVVELNDADQSFRGSEADDLFGLFTSAGDFDGDGTRELVIGHSTEGVNFFDTGPWLSTAWPATSD